MNLMRTVIATICLNEMQWLPLLYEQHREWPGLVKWIFVEAADAAYAEANPDLVTGSGLSSDGTSEFLSELQKIDRRVEHVPHGFCRHRDKAQGKVEARQRCVEAGEMHEPDLLVCLDADEFYPVASQEAMTRLASDESVGRCTGFRFRQREIWHPPSVENEPLFQREVVGGFWDMAHVRFWRWVPGMRYERNHNWPEIDGEFLTKNLGRFERSGFRCHQYVHLGFASRLRPAKNAYYVARGEGAGDGRELYVESRRAFETWKPGDALPGGARVVPYDGPVPEVFERCASDWPVTAT